MSSNIHRFEGLAEAYDAFRPSYPADVFDLLAAEAPDVPKCAVDVGAGTGLSTQGLMDHLPEGWLVIGAEPGEDMRRVLARRFRDRANFHANDSVAEGLKLPSGSVGMLTAFTAFHWFDRAAFFAESARVLAPGGVMAVVRNRRTAQPLIDAFDAFVEQNSTEITDMKRRDLTKEPTVRELAALAAFKSAASRTFTWDEQTNCRRMVDLYLTRSTVAFVVRTIGLPAVRDALEAIYRSHYNDGPMRLQWETTVKWARRR